MSKRFVSVLLIAAAACHFGRAQSQPTYNLSNRHTYLLTPSTSAFDYHAARAFAKSLGGYLVAINDANEQNFVAFNYASAGAPKRWIGLTDEVTEGTFVWDSGEAVTFTNFAAGEPNNGGAGGNQDFGAIAAGGLWSDESSPSTGSGPTQGIVELAFGDRVDFDLQTVNCTGAFPTPLGASGDPEGVSWNGAGGTARPALVTTGVFASQPISGTQGMYMLANGAVTSPPLGGPFPRPANPLANEVRIPVPPGAAGVSFAWEFLNGEGGTSAVHNDGLSIAVVDGAGNLLADLVYADTNPSIALLPMNICSTGNVREILPLGPQAFSGFLPQTNIPMFLSIVCWNGGDNLVPSACELDAVQFWGDGQFRLTITAPFGPGSIRFQNTGGSTGDTYWTAITLSKGAFPYGWFFGLDITAFDLILQITSGPPFVGTLVAPGISTFTLASGAVSGASVYAVSVRFAPSSQFLDSSAPRFFLVP